jgi:hypothetical protein
VCAVEARQREGSDDREEREHPRVALSTVPSVACVSKTWRKMRTVAPHSAKSERTSASLPYIVPTVTPSSAATSAKRISLYATKTTGADRPSSPRALVRVEHAFASISRSDAQDVYAPSRRVSRAPGGVCGSQSILRLVKA